MGAVVLGAVAVAWAGEGEQRPVPEGSFTVARADADLSVREIGLPRAIVIDPKFRECRVSVGWTGKAWAPTVLDGCHPNIADAALEGAKRWVIDVRTPPSVPRELFEFWYVFPIVHSEGDKDGSVRVFVRQAHDQRIVLTDPGLDVLDWSIKARVPAEYPEAAVAIDTTDTECEAKIEIAPNGTPGAIEVSGCDEVFRPGLADDLRRWRFGGPELDGVPFWSGVTVAAKFVRSVDPGAPGKVDPGKVEILFPPDPNLGERTVAREAEAVVDAWEAPPMPTWPALFAMNHKSFAEVRVFDVRWPEPLADAADEVTCDVLFQVNSERRVWTWAESCDDRVRERVEAAGAAWSLTPGKIEPGERYARFRGTFVFPAGGGHPELRIAASDLLSNPRQLPQYVSTYVAATTLRTEPPKLPRGFATEVLEPTVTCEYAVTVDPGGRPAEIAPLSCPGGYGEFAERALQRWRWTPAEADGKPIPSHVGLDRIGRSSHGVPAGEQDDPGHHQPEPEPERDLAENLRRLPFVRRVGRRLAIQHHHRDAQHRHQDSAEDQQPVHRVPRPRHRSRADRPTNMGGGCCR
ncbi:MAG: hypothetical protein ABMB14_13175 [Myxococcota bacterium]